MIVHNVEFIQIYAITPLFTLKSFSETSCYFSYAELMLDVILNIMKLQASIIGISNLESNIMSGPVVLGNAGFAIMIK